MLGPDVVLALSIILPLTGAVFTGITGGIAYSTFQRLWDLSREDVAEVMVALLQSALDAVADCLESGLDDPDQTLTKAEKKQIKKRITEFRQSRKGISKYDTQLIRRIAELSDAAPQGRETPSDSSFGPLLNEAAKGLPEGIRRTLDANFVAALRMNFRRKLRDDDRVYRLWTADTLEHLAGAVDLWRKLDEDRHRGLIRSLAREDGAIEKILLRISANVDATREDVLDALDGVMRYLGDHFDEMRSKLDRLEAVVQRSATPEELEPASDDPFDLLNGYPEPRPEWVGRRSELAELGAAWESYITRVFTVVGFGGEGKTALARRFTESLRRLGGDTRPVVVWWSFYFNKAADSFFTETLGNFNVPLEQKGHRLSAEQRAAEVARLLREGYKARRVLLVLDGLESLQDQTAGRVGRIDDAGVRKLLGDVLDDQPIAEPDADAPPPGMILITTREAIAGLRRAREANFTRMELENLSSGDGATLLIDRYGLDIKREEAETFATEVGGHALTLTLTATLLKESGATSASLAELRSFIVSEEAELDDKDLTTRAYRLPGYVLRHCRDALTAEDRQLMRLMSCCVRPAMREDFEEVFLQALTTPKGKNPFNDKLAGRKYTEVRNRVVRRLLQLHLIDGKEDTGYDMHPLIRLFFYEQEDGRGALTDAQRRAIHSRFFDVLPARQKKHHPDTMEEMRPLIDAVLHGCRAGRAQAALRDVYYSRIDRKDDLGRTTSYLSADLGALETELELLRAFFPDGESDGEPIVSNDASKAFLISAAAYALKNSGRPGLAVRLFARGLAMRRKQRSWANASTVCQNLWSASTFMGRLPDAERAAADALDYVARVPDDHQFKRTYTKFSHVYAATGAALGGDDPGAAEHFAATLKLHPNDWVASLAGGWHCTWLGRRGEFDRARPAAGNNARDCAEMGGLYEQTFTLATQAFVERLAWAAGDSKRRSLDEMRRYARDAVEVGRRSGHHFYLTYAILEAGRCAIACATHDPSRRAELIPEADGHLSEVEDRAEYGGYRLIEADAHVARAQLARLDGDEDGVHTHCRAAIDICDDPECGYAWAKQDAEALMTP